MKYLTVTVIVVILATTISAESCIKCNSKEDEHCATDPTKIMPSACPNATSDCYARVLDGHTYRGCAQDLEPSLAEKCWNSTNDCDRCFGVNSEPGCNKGMIPVHRPLCHQCDGKLTDSCAIGNLLHPIPCPIYKVDDQCVTRKSNGLTVRGCTQDLELIEAEKCMNRTTDDCLRCKGSVEITDDTGCNNMIIPSHRRLCVQCVGTLTDDCGSNAMFYPMPCPIYQMDEKCYTRKQIKKKELRRGCLSSAGDLCPNATYCLTCDGNGCNNIDASSNEIPDAPGLATLTSVYGTLLFCMIALVLKI